MAGTKSDPDNVGVQNEYAGFKAPRRADASTITFYGDNPRGNRVDRNAIPKTMGASTSNGSQAKPLGQPESRGY